MRQDAKTLGKILYTLFPMLSFRSDIAATYVHKVVGVGFLINTKTGIIEDVMVTLISDLLKIFYSYLS